MVDSPATGHDQATRPLGRSKDRVVFWSAPMQDLTLRLELLIESDGTEYASRRNIFQAAEDVGEPAGSSIKTAIENAHPDPSQYAPINLKFFGAAEIRANVRWKTLDP
jgi:hypothetical protein